MTSGTSQTAGAGGATGTTGKGTFSSRRRSPGAQPPGHEHPTAATPWLLAVPAGAVLALLLALVAAGGAPAPVPPGLPDPGLVTGWGLPVSRLLFDGAAVAVIGALVAVLLLPSGELEGLGRRALGAASWSAAAWAVSAAVLTLLTASDVLGVPPANLFSRRLLGYVWQLEQTRSVLLVVACAVVVAAYSRWIATRGGAAVLLAVTVGGLLPVLFTGHSAAAADHDLATSSLVVHVVSASVWVGGLCGVLLLLRRSPRVLAVVLPRYSALALACFGAVAFSGLLNAWVRASGDLLLWAGSGYGALLLVKIGALVGLGCLGWVHRRRSIEALSAGRPRAFARLAGVEVAVMAATIGVAVALSRTPPPAGAVVDLPSHGAGHETLGADVAPFTVTRLVTDWRPDTVSLVLLAIGLGCYLAGVRRLRRAGQPWPAYRVLLLVVATAVALLATSGGLATYSTATFSLQVAQFLTLLIVVPTLVLFARPVTLALRVYAPAGAGGHAETPPGPLRSRAALLLADPLNGLIMVTALMFCLYATPLLDTSLRSAPAHLGVNLAVFAVGCAFWWSVLGVEPVPALRPLSYRLGVLLGFLAMLTGIAVRIYLSDVLLGGAWFGELDWEWIDLPTDQRAGAQLMWGAVVLLGPVLAVLARLGATPEASPAEHPVSAGR